MQKLVLVMSTTEIIIPCLLGLVGRYHFRDEWTFKWRLEMGGHLRGCLLVGQQLMVCYTAGSSGTSMGWRDDPSWSLVKH